MSPGDLVEIFADNTCGGIGLVIEVEDAYVQVLDTDSRALWYAHDELWRLHDTHISGEWVTAP